MSPLLENGNKAREEAPTRRAKSLCRAAGDTVGRQTTSKIAVFPLSASARLPTESVRQQHEEDFGCEERLRNNDGAGTTV